MESHLEEILADIQILKTNLGNALLEMKEFEKKEEAWTQEIQYMERDLEVMERKLFGEENEWHPGSEYVTYANFLL